METKATQKVTESFVRHLVLKECTFAPLLKKVYALFFFFFATCIQIPLQNAEETLLLLFPLQNPLLRCYSPLLFVPFIRQAEPSSVKARKHLYFFDVASSDVMEGPNRGRSGKSLCLAAGPNIHTGLRQPSIDTQRQSRLGERT